jgi:hypothetical protein
MAKVRLTLKSSNKKTGPIPVSTTEEQSCPSTCPLKKNGCYADGGPLAIVWRSVPEVGLTWNKFCAAIANLPAGQLWRHNQAGDLPHKDQKINVAKLARLLVANKGKRGFTYTHHDMASAHNRRAIATANRNGFTINLSANNLDHADELTSLNIGPVVTLAPADQRENGETPQGRKVTVCPATTRDDVTCAACKLCAVANRTTIIAFPVHGASHKRAATAMKG